MFVYTLLWAYTWVLVKSFLALLFLVLEALHGEVSMYIRLAVTPCVYHNSIGHTILPPYFTDIPQSTDSPTTTQGTHTQWATHTMTLSPPITAPLRRTNQISD